MAVDSIIIDTNAYALFKKGETFSVEIVNKAEQIILNPIVLGELFSGFALGNKEHKNKIELNQFLESEKVALVEIDYSTSEYFAEIFKELRNKRKPIPTNDMWIAATAKEYDLAIFSNDKHFTNLDNLIVISDPKDLK